MTVMRYSVVFAIAFMCFGAAESVRAQQIRVCSSLHNDLVNFDRRAHQVGGYYLPDIADDRAALARAEDEYNAICSAYGSTPESEDCAGLSQQVAILSTQLWDRILSPIGGSDPVRLRILMEMRRNRCPFPNDPVADLTNSPDRIGTELRRRAIRGQ